MPNRLNDSFLFDEQDDTVGSTTDFNQDSSLDDSFLFEEKDKGIISSAMDTVSGVADASVDTVQAIPKYVSGFFEGGGAAIENRRSIASKINASLESAQIGIASGLSQASKAANDFFGYDGKDALTDALDGYVKDNSKRVSKRLDTAIKNLQSEEEKQKLTPEGEFFRQADTGVLESAGGMLVGGGAGSLAKGLAFMAPQVFGQSYNDLKEEGEDEKGAVTHALAKTLFEIVPESLALNKLLNLPDGILRKMLDMTAYEGGTEMITSLSGSFYDASVRNKNLDWGEEWEKGIESFKLGAAGGLTVGAVAATPQIVAKTTEGVVDATKSIKESAQRFTKSTPDQTGQPSELFNPTHKAGGGVDVQVATKNGKIIPDTYINESGNSIRDANAVPNNPDESVDVTNDVSAVAASIKAEVFGKQGGKEADVSLPEEKANEVIDSLEQQNQQLIDSEFAAPKPEIGNQEVIDTQNFEPTQAEINQAEINSQTEVAPVAGQVGLPPEIPVTQPELNQKKIEGYASQGLADGNVAQKKQQKLTRAKNVGIQPELQKSKIEPGKRLKPTESTVDITKAEKLKPSEILKYSTDKPRLSAQKMADLTKSIQDKGITRPAILLKNRKGKVTLEDGHHMTRIAEELGLDVPVKVIKQTKYESDTQVASRVLDAVSVSETTKNIEKVANEASTSPKNDLPQPTQAQIESGNYKKAHVKVQGLDITIENPKGSKREGVDPDGNKWSVDMPASYGYFKGSVGADSEKGAKGNKIEQLDTYIGKNPESQEVFIVNQQDPATSKFDELKVIVGSDNVNDAMSIYFGGFSDNTGGSRAKSVYQVPMLEFKELLNKGLGTKEISNSIGALKKISPLKLKKMARQSGADKLVDQHPKQTVLKNKIKQAKIEKVSQNVPRETKRNVLNESAPVTTSKQSKIEVSPDEKPASKTKETSQKNETETQRDNSLGNEGVQQPSEVLDSYRSMHGKEISYDVDVEETGETFKVTVDAGKVMKDLDVRVDALKKLRDCV